MGQRLVVTIEKGEKSIAKIYYHWSAYTYNALYETRNIINEIYSHEDKTESELLLRLIRFCENNGGGIDGVPSEFDYIRDLYPNEMFKDRDINRSNGLIALSSQGMADMQGWSEGDVYIDLDTDQVDFCVYYGYEYLDDYVKERLSWDDEFHVSEVDDIPEFDFDLGRFDVNDIDAIIASLDTTDAHIIKCNDGICEIIE